MMHTRRVLGTAAVAVTVGGGLLLPTQAANAAPTCSYTANTTTHTYSLTGDCTVTATQNIEAGWSIDGNGHTLTADATGGFSGPIIRSASGTAGQDPPPVMNVRHLVIRTTGFSNATGPVVGILFDGAQGQVSDVHMTGVNTGSAADEGYGVEADNSVGAAFTLANRAQVKIGNGTSISGYQTAGIYGHGDLKLTVLRAVIGAGGIPGKAVDGVLADNGAHGSVKESTITLTGASSPSQTSFSAGVRIIQTRRVEVRRNVFSGADADFGVSVEGPSPTGNKTTGVIDCNVFNRTAPTGPDPYGVAAGLWSGAKTQLLLTNATFQGQWSHKSAVIGTSVGAGPSNIHDGHCPPNAPRHVVAHGGDGRSKVTWKASVPFIPNYAPVTTYKVSAKAAGHKAVVQTVTSPATSAVLKGLNNKLNYKVTVTAQSSGGQTGATDKLYATKVSLSATPARVHRGGKSTLSGRLTSKDSSVRLSNRKVQIWAKPLGGKWSQIGTVTTKGGGHFTRVVRTQRKTTYKAVYLGKPGLAGQHKTTVSVR